MPLLLNVKFPFDVVPRIITAVEWKHIEDGIKQRLRALNIFLKDIYHQQFIPYNNRGRWLSIGVADWVLGKGMLMTTMPVNNLRVIVLNTHLHANYGGSWQPDNRLAQIQHDQVQDLLAQVQALPGEALVVVCGDFNFPRQTFLYETLLAEGGLFDPLADDPRPTYKSLPLVPARYSMTLDFTLVRLPHKHPVQLTADIVPIECSTARRPRQRFLTDHYAVTLCVNWDKE